MTTTGYRKRVMSEIEAVPDEYLPYVLQLVQTFRESVTLKSAKESLKQGWHEARSGEVSPISTLWENIDAE
jgi:hypothetical protein